MKRFRRRAPYAAADAFGRALAARLAASRDAKSPIAAVACQAAARLRGARAGLSSLGSVTVVADDLCVSERHLRRVFREAFGVGPKTFARLARFDRAVKAVQ